MVSYAFSIDIVVNDTENIEMRAGTESVMSEMEVKVSGVSATESTSGKAEC